jgi:hypothetical protein
MEKREITAAQWRLFAIIMSLGVVFGVARFFIYPSDYYQTSLLFMGVPVLLAALLALTPKAKSVTGIMIKVVTLAMLLSGPILAEGFICVIMASPLFYLVVIVMGLIYDEQKKKKGTLNAVGFFLITTPFMLLSLEGTTEMLTVTRERSVHVERIVEAAPEAVALSLTQVPDFKKPLPSLLGIGFPRPLGAEGLLRQVGDQLVVHFSPGEGRPAGDLTIVVMEKTENRMRFDCLSDTSHIRHWLTWSHSTVSWTGLGDGRTQIAWELTYDRDLDPFWYFGPIEDFFVARAADYLIDAVAVPKRLL